MSETQEPATREQQLKHALQLISGENRDEEKFVGLLILSKILDPTKNQDDLVYVHDHLDWHFIDRLLLTKDTEALPADTLRSIAVNFLFGFCTQKQLIKRPQLAKRIPYFTPILLGEHTTPDVALTIVQIIHALAADGEFIVEVDSAIPACISYIEHTIKNKNPSEDQNDTTNDVDDSIILETVQTLGAYLTRVRETTSLWSLFLRHDWKGDLLLKLAKAFTMCSKSLKFPLGDTVLQVVTMLGDTGESLKDPNGLPIWAQQTREGFKDIIRSNLPLQLRDQVLVFTAVMLRTLGPQWLLGSASKSSKGGATSPIIVSPSGKSISDEKFATLIVHMACGECRVLLDDYPVHPQAQTQSQSPPGKVQDRNDTILPLCAEIMDHCIQALLSQDAQDTSSKTFSVTVLMSIREALFEAFTAIRLFVVDSMAQYGYTKSISVLDNIAMASCLRALSTWLKEEDLPAEEVNHLIPFIVTIGGKSLKCIEVAPMDFLAPALSHLLGESSVLDVFIKEGGIPMLVQYWKTRQAKGEMANCALLEVFVTILVNNNAVISSEPALLDVLPLLSTDAAHMAKLSDSFENLVTHSYLVLVIALLIRGLKEDQLRKVAALLPGELTFSLQYIIKGYKLYVEPNQASFEDVKELWGIAVSALRDSFSSKTLLRELMGSNPLCEQLAECGVLETRKGSQ
ncbi:Neurochondrin-domain-containing protein [Phlyctochytrium arcticum]|nr:Neurochondrin-domain-containing protein [Phlyctochytrium arcticum]